MVTPLFQGDGHILMAPFSCGPRCLDPQGMADAPAWSETPRGPSEEQVRKGETRARQEQSWRSACPQVTWNQQMQQQASRCSCSLPTSWVSPTFQKQMLKCRTHLLLPLFPAKLLTNHPNWRQQDQPWDCPTLGQPRSLVAMGMSPIAPRGSSC